MQTNQYRNPETFLGFLNYFKQAERKSLGFDNRPAFPPIIYEPSIEDCYHNRNMSDYGAFMAGTGAVVMVSTLEAMFNNPALAKFQVNSFYRFIMMNYRLNLAIAPCFGFICAYLNSQYRLSGKIYNGQNWKNRSQKLRMALVNKNRPTGVRF